MLTCPMFRAQLERALAHPCGPARISEALRSALALAEDGLRWARTVGANATEDEDLVAFYRELADRLDGDIREAATQPQLALTSKER